MPASDSNAIATAIASRARVDTARYWVSSRSVVPDAP
jgi:hypothetical protein